MPANAVDLGDALLAPGFVDVQVNGTGSVDFASSRVEQMVGAVDELVARGTTGVLLTICSAPLDAYDVMLNALARCARRAPKQWSGCTSKAPFSAARPARTRPRPYVRRISRSSATSSAAHGDLVRLVTLAPEADPGFAAIRALTDAGVVVALGHSTVDFEGARAAADAGARMVTHLFNGMGPLHHRAPGLPGAALNDTASCRRSSSTSSTSIPRW